MSDYNIEPPFTPNQFATDLEYRKEAEKFQRKRAEAAEARIALLCTPPHQKQTEVQMNKEEALKLADVMIGGRFTSTGVAIYDATSSELLAFANACEKIGMEKASKICANRSAEFWKLRNTKDWSSYVEGQSDEADECEAAIRKEIK